MDFRLSAEQQMLRDSARRYLADQAQTPAVDWAQFAALGWLAMPVSLPRGGLAASLEDMTLLCEELGRAALPVSWVAEVLLPAGLLERSDSALAQRCSEALAQGQLRFALALYEPGRRYASDPALSAQRLANGHYRLDGEKVLVLGGPDADQLLITAQLEREGVRQTALFCLPTQSPGLTLRRYETLDGRRAADLHCQDVQLPPEQLLTEGAACAEHLEQALDQARIGLCAEMLGAADRAIELTAEYLRTRQQFGRALAEFQALQHQLAEMAIEADAARSQLYRAIAASDSPAAQRAAAVSACCLKLLQASKTIAGMAIHLHGGIGVSCEYPVGHTLPCALVAERIWGDREYHLARYLSVCD